MRRAKDGMERLGAIVRARGGSALKAAVTLGILVVAARHANWPAVAHTIATATPTGLALAVAPFLLIPVFGGLRWWSVLRGIGQPARIGSLSMFFSVAMMAGQALPAVAGDGIRVWLASRRGAHLQSVIHSVMLERVFMLLALLALATVAQPLLKARLGESAPHWIAPLLLLCGLAGLAGLLLADRIAPRFGERPLVHAIAAFASDTRRVVLSSWGGVTILLAILSNLNFVLAAMLLGDALHMPATFADFLAFMPLVILATTLPISLGGWGVREGVLVALLGTIGIPASDALALSLLIGALAAAAGLPGLIAWWLLRQPEQVDRPHALAMGI